MLQQIRHRHWAILGLVTALALAGMVAANPARHRAAAEIRPTGVPPTASATPTVAIDAPLAQAVKPATKPAPAKPKPAPAKKAAPAKRVPKPATPANLPTAIEPLAVYVGQTACEPGFRPGTAALGALLVKTYPGTTFGGDYACGSDGLISEHYEGRALDWMDSARIPAQAAQAGAVLHWLLDADAHGNAFAIARRLGVMYLIWANQIWSADTGAWTPYQNCASTPQPSRDSYCHRNHIHISLSWDGAWARTSFFTGRVFAKTDFGPCRAKDLNWAAPYTAPNWTGCVSYPKLTPTPGMTTVMQNLQSWSGDVITRGSTGPAVMAVQAALGVPANSVFDPATARAVAQFQRVRKLAVNAIVDAATWRALMAPSPAPAATVKPATKSGKTPAKTPAQNTGVASVGPARVTFTPKIQPPATTRRPSAQPVVGAKKP